MKCEITPSDLALNNLRFDDFCLSRFQSAVGNHEAAVFLGIYLTDFLYSGDVIFKLKFL